MKHVVNAFAVLLLLLVGTVFVSTPASLLHVLMDGKVALGYSNRRYFYLLYFSYTSTS